jgi:sulfatase maturation enzyme AslB (radical SAM superfamily)
MNYLKMYCDIFGLILKKDSVFDKENNLLGKVEDKKYIHFTYQSNPVKLSDLWLAVFERIRVH